MATRKEQLDAYVFARRRMISNLLQPSPTGGDEAAPRPFRNLTGSISIALALLLLMLVMGIGHTSVSSSWKQGGQLLVDQEGTRYIIVNGQAHAVINTTSAYLLVPNDTAHDPVHVTDSKLATLGKPMGDPVGIRAAPDYLPPESSLNLEQWTVCSEPASGDTAQTALEIGYGPSRPLASNEGLIAYDKLTGTTYLISKGEKYPFAPNETNAILAALNITAAPPTVSSSWLATLPQGHEIAIPTLRNAGQTAPAGAPSTMSTVGDFGSVTPPNSSAQYFIETDDGLAQVSQLTFMLFGQSQSKQNDAQQLQPGFFGSNLPKNYVDSSAPSSVGTLGFPTWPSEQPTIMNGANDTTTSTLCATYSGVHNGTSAQYVISAGASLPQPIPNGNGVEPSAATQTASQAGVVYVRPGSGVIAAPIDGPQAAHKSHATSGNGSSTVPATQYLITDTCYSYQLLTGDQGSDGDSSDSVVSRLGYGSAKAFQVPWALLSMLQSGPSLGIEQAGVGQSQTGDE